MQIYLDFLLLLDLSPLPSCSRLASLAFFSSALNSAPKFSKTENPCWPVNQSDILPTYFWACECLNFNLGQLKVKFKMSFLTVTDDPRRWSVTMCLEKLYVLIFSFRFMFPTCRIVYFYNCFSCSLNMWLKYPNLKLSVSGYSRHILVEFFLIENIL